MVCRTLHGLASDHLPRLTFSLPSSHPCLPPNVSCALPPVSRTVSLLEEWHPCPQGHTALGSRLQATPSSGEPSRAVYLTTCTAKHWVVPLFIYFSLHGILCLSSETSRTLSPACAFFAFYNILLTLITEKLYSTLWKSISVTLCYR